MHEYIEREALISKIVNTPFGVNCSGETEDYKEGMLDGLVKKQHNVLDMIEKQPVADVVEVDKVAEMFAEQFGDKCPCNFNDNDEWLPYVCEHTNTCDCPCKEGWKQFVKHYEERSEKQ